MQGREFRSETKRKTENAVRIVPAKSELIRRIEGEKRVRDGNNRHLFFSPSVTLYLSSIF